MEKLICNVCFLPQPWVRPPRRRAQAGDADHGFYVRLDTGASFSTNAEQDVGNSVGTAAILGGGVGYRFNQYIRADVTLSYRDGYQVNSSKVMEGLTYFTKGNVYSLAGLANAYVEPFQFGIIRPYIGGGVGFAATRSATWRSACSITMARFREPPALLSPGREAPASASRSHRS